VASSSAFLRLAAANTVMSAACAKAQKNGVTRKPSASATNKPRLDFADIQHVCTGNKIEARHGSAWPLTGWRLNVRFWHLADIDPDAEHVR